MMVLEFLLVLYIWVFDELLVQLLICAYTIDRFSNNETRIMINNFSLRGLILMKLKI